MKRPEEMTKEELQEYIEQEANKYFKQVLFNNAIPYWNLPQEFIIYFTKYSRN